ncbi:uncharacterized protein SPAPADRAFT_59202 [Spathaspora passalidarum NRRL Y-27907]|uniref:Uncharacterized protein n=1 Tax=Spathaspora passalidarum (strain NRRL Y-27907 / 11-Y1) TaxID=619300 RepID=G3AJ86_SPAPN|nr:uncharacterized protein SPAPADRAFT_59202 [Spathaspora passalidarum NRRL Y-27907]EGW33843.1 hypothetical protein SPAPADRAFT_59202 [Spathaspora passalidarum NRRL Y-27907]
MTASLKKTDSANVSIISTQSSISSIKSKTKSIIGKFKGKRKESTHLGTIVEYLAIR